MSALQTKLQSYSFPSLKRSSLIVVVPCLLSAFLLIIYMNELYTLTPGAQQHGRLTNSFFDVSNGEKVACFPPASPHNSTAPFESQIKRVSDGAHHRLVQIKPTVKGCPQPKPALIGILTTAKHEVNTIRRQIARFKMDEMNEALSPCDEIDYVFVFENGTSNNHVG
ncbi:hypothetical protein HDU98_005143 [Podochytrium sp. JEL0797]|nr:hypothetical protein HDU98_005143 [Podochytrium sp. JEL0797]